MKTSDKIDPAVWSYGIISRLLHRNEEDGTLEQDLLQFAAQSFRNPDGRSVSFSHETLRKWLYRYRHCSLHAIIGNASRYVVCADFGGCRGVDEGIDDCYMATWHPNALLH